MATNGTIEVVADSACHAAGSRRASFASIDGMPASAVTRNAPNNTIAAVSPLPMMCTAAHSANDHSIGCRVIRWMPRGGCTLRAWQPTIVGLRRLTEATNSTNATSITATSTQRSHTGENHSGVVERLAPGAHQKHERDNRKQ